MKTNVKGQVLITLDRETEMEYHNGFWCVPVSVLRGHNIIVTTINSKPQGSGKSQDEKLIKTVEYMKHKLSNAKESDNSSSKKDCYACCPDNYLNKCTNDYKFDKGCDRRKRSPS